MKAYGWKDTCKEILGKDFSKPDELASIRREGLVKKSVPACPASQHRDYRRYAEVVRGRGRLCPP